MRIFTLTLVLASFGLFGIAKQPTGRLLLVMSTDWEGEALEETNLNAIQQFRQDFPEVKIIQFLNAAYFTKPDAVESEVRQSISSALMPQDELGLHIHGWKTLFEASGVSFRSGPTAWGEELQNCGYDCGFDVPINTYTESEVQKVVHFSVEKLNANGFGRARSFRAGAWMGDSNVLGAIAAEGFTLDSSEVPPQLLQAEIEQYPFWDWIETLWKSVTPSVQPHTVQTDAGSLLEMPDNGALADYTTAEQILSVFKIGEASLQKDPSHDVYVQIGFHQETAAEYLPRVRDALLAIRNEVSLTHLPFAMADLPLHL